MMLNLSLTFDYELFGDGGGDVFEQMIYPTDRILHALNKHQVKATFFIEIVEYLKIKEVWSNGETMGYSKNPVTAIEGQLIEMAKNGHDVQLHIHPQWINARWNGKSWDIDRNYWRTSALPYTRNEKVGYGLVEILALGKKTLEDLVHPYVPGYRCEIFRAGGYNIEPSDEVVRALKQTGFIADSSVYAGGYEDSYLSRYDYRNVDGNIPYWFSESDVLKQCTERTEGILEIPIASKRIIRLFKYDLNRVKILWQNRKKSFDKFNVRTEQKSVVDKILFFFRKESITWDCCLLGDGLTSFFLRQTKRIKERSDYTFHPFVIVGHPKDFYSEKTLNRLLNSKNISFLTLHAVTNRIYSERNDA